jgi:hypothetical protein
VEPALIASSAASCAALKQVCPVIVDLSYSFFRRSARSKQRKLGFSLGAYAAEAHPLSLAQ